ncbi:MAG: hypothetical protein WBN07_02075 [Woeseiaceae bacterium]
MNRDHAETRRSSHSRVSLLAFSLCFLLCACGAPSTGPEGEIRIWLDQGIAATEAKERGELLDMISPAYADSRGYNRSRIGDVLRVYFMRMNSIELITKVDEIKVMGETAAEVSLTVGMAGTKDSLLGFSADAYQFSLELEKTAGDWLLISAQWAELGKELQ